MNIEIAGRLVQLRKQHSLSQEELAEKLGISRQAVSKWERAEASPDTDNLIALAKLYNVSLDDLLKTDEEPETPPKRGGWYENDKNENESKKKNPWLLFPYPIVAFAIFMLIGFTTHAYQFAWLIFLTVPLYYSLVSILYKKKQV